MSRYLIVIEPTETGFSAYSPDLPGCVSTGRTRDEVERNMREAIQFHLEGLREEGLQVPEPRTDAAFCEIGANKTLQATPDGAGLVALSRRPAVPELGRSLNKPPHIA